jgi:hypothetical protein
VVICGLKRFILASSRAEKREKFEENNKMKNTNTNVNRNVLLSVFALLLIAASTFAAPIVRQSAGSSPAAMSAGVDLFRLDLGGADNGAGGSYTTGRREIDWEDAPEYEQNNSNSYIPINFYANRGVILNSPCSIGTNSIIASKSSPAAQMRFGNIQPTHASSFKAFSGQKIASSYGSGVDCNIIDITFVIPGTNVPATVNGFGAVFTDVDILGDGNMLFFDAAGNRIGGNILAQSSNNGLSFQGVSYNTGEKIARVRIYLGNHHLSYADGAMVSGSGSPVDAVALDDIIYGEPRAIGQHSSDFDGDGATDMSVFRPSNGVWYILNSGSNTYTAAQFGANGDIPADGDFDGDSRNDLTVFRPSTGIWYSFKSSDNQVRTVQFGQSGDKPVAGDYDKDGKTDFAVWRPSDGNYYIYRSSDNQAQITHWGANGDVPIGAAY